MNMTGRKDFLKMAMAATVVPAVVVAGEKTGCAGARLEVPEGAAFKDMDGAYAALITPFRADGSLNEEMIEKVVDYGIRRGLRGFYLTGSTGEGFLQSSDERLRVYRRAVKAAAGRAKMIAHVGCLATHEAVALAKGAAAAGVDWVSSVAPVYFGQSFSAAYEHYNAIAGATDLPFMIYSVGKQVNPDRDRKFFDIPNVMGMKYTGYAYWTVQALKLKLDKPAVFFAGADEQVLSALACKNVFSGCIGTTDNFIPAHFAKICALAAEGRFAEAAVLQEEVVRLVELVVADENESYWKSIMRYIGLDCGSHRLPAGKPLTEAEYAAYVAKIEKLGFIRKDDAIL